MEGTQNKVSGVPVWRWKLKLRRAVGLEAACLSLPSPSLASSPLSCLSTDPLSPLHTLVLSSLLTLLQILTTAQSGCEQTLVLTVSQTGNLVPVTGSTPGSGSYHSRAPIVQQCIPALLDSTTTPPRRQALRKVTWPSCTVLSPSVRWGWC